MAQTNYSRIVFNCGRYGHFRVIHNEDNTYFCAKDIATALGFTDPRKTVQQVCKDRIRAMFITNGGEQSLCFITMEDVYRLLQHGKIIDMEFIRIMREINDRIARETDLCDEYEGKDDYVGKVLNSGITERIADILDEIHELQDDTGVSFEIEGIYYEDNDGEFIRIV